MLKVVGASWLQTRISTYILAAVALLGIGTIILGEFGHVEQDGTYSATVCWNHKAGYRIDFLGQGNDLTAVPLNAARAYYKTGIFESGWSMIEIETSAKYPDTVQAYAAGFLEGSLTWQLIHHHWYNTVYTSCKSKSIECQTLRRYLRDNAAIIRERAELLEADDPFWHMVRLFYAQLDGMEAGWRFAVRRSRQSVELAYEDFLWLAMASDASALEEVFNVSSADAAESKGMIFLKKLERDGLQPLLAIGHNTATAYSKMLRLLKRYTFGFHVLPTNTAAQVPSRSVVMSSYPGALSSHDEFYIMRGEARELIATGTPLSGTIRSLWKNLLHTDNQLMSSVRLMAANRLATDGRSWSRIVAYQNNAATGNQWVIVEPRSMAVWLIEQLLGITHATEYTKLFKKFGFLACTGMPTSQGIWDVLGLPAEEEIARKSYLINVQENVTTLEDFKKLMRGYNQEESTVDADVNDLLRAVAYRGDLDETPSPFGVVDSKVFATDADRFETLDVVSGPAAGNCLDSFNWAESFPNISHVGQPDTFGFDAVSPLWIWT